MTTNESSQFKTLTAEELENISDEEVTKAKISLETAQANWRGLERFFAQGRMISVDKRLDIVDVAWEIQEDNAEQIKAWMSSKLVENTTDKQAKHWHENNTPLWTVVVRPWILVQDKDY